jgi:lipid A 3-O-deacylase
MNCRQAPGALACLLAAALLVGAGPAIAEGPGLLSLGVGVFDQTTVDLGLGYFRDGSGPHDHDPEFRIEYRFGDALWSAPHVTLNPLVGGLLTSSGAHYGFAGLQLDLAFGSFVLTPSLAAGLWGNGSGKDMGSIVEFRTQIEAGFRWPDGRRMTAALSHISNANIGRVNHGANNVTLYYSLPL